MVRTLAHDHLPDHAVGNGLLGLPPLVRGGGLRPDLHNPLAFTHCVNELFCFLVGVAHGLFEVYVLTFVHGRERDLGVPVVGSRHNHSVNIRPRDQLTIIGKGLRFMILGIDAASLGVHIANRDNLAGVVVLRRIFGEGFADIRAAPAASDEADIDTVVGSQDTSGIQLVCCR
jgi:hypothetical protein